MMLKILNIFSFLILSFIIIKTIKFNNFFFHIKVCYNIPIGCNINLLFILVLLVCFLIPFESALCSDSFEESKSESFMTDEEHRIWFSNAQKLHEDFIKEVAELRNEKEVLVTSCNPTNISFQDILDGLNKTIKNEIALRKKFFNFVNNSLMPSYELRDCYQQYTVGVETTNFFITELNNVLNLDSTISQENKNSFNLYKKLVETNLKSLDKFEKDFEWSDNED